MKFGGGFGGVGGSAGRPNAPDLNTGPGKGRHEVDAFGNKRTNGKPDGPDGPGGRSRLQTAGKWGDRASNLASVVGGVTDAVGMAQNLLGVLRPPGGPSPSVGPNSMSSIFGAGGGTMGSTGPMRLLQGLGDIIQPMMKMMMMQMMEEMMEEMMENLPGAAAGAGAGAGASSGGLTGLGGGRRPNTFGTPSGSGASGGFGAPTGPAAMFASGFKQFFGAASQIPNVLLGGNYTPYNQQAGGTAWRPPATGSQGLAF